MSQGRRRRKTQDAYAAYRRPTDDAAPQAQEIGEDIPPQPFWDADTVWDDEPVEPQYDNDAYYVPERMTRQIIATNRAVRLSCTLAALSGLFALFLCFAEQESRAIRRFALQSVSLSAAGLILAAITAVIGFTLGSIPLMGFVVTLMCWLAFLGALVALTVIRVRLMLFAWRGIRFRLPVIDGWLESRFL